MNLVQKNMFNASMRRTLQCVILSIICGTFPAFCQTGSSRHVPLLVPNRYTVLLSDQPVGSRFASREDMQAPAADVYRQQIKTRQASLKSEIESRGMRVTGSVTDLLNALFVTATPDKVAQLRSLPGVRSVTQMRRFKPMLNRAITNMNGTIAWNAVGGASNAGAGIKIGIIDSGIDQTHPAFQDPSLTMPAGFPKCTTGYPADCAYTNNKVIVARSYIRQTAVEGTTASDQAQYSQPDDYSPRDRFGHGTATAACAAGFTNTGAASSTTGGGVSFSGMAPKAFLGNYKIQGSPGVNDGATDQALIQAVEDAVTDGMNIISTSYGSIATSGWAVDPVAMAYETAAQKVVVVAAAGDDGEDTYVLGVEGAAANDYYPYFNSISSPGTAPSVITAGASTNSHVFTPSVSVNSSGAASNLKGVVALAGDSFVYSFNAISAPLVDDAATGDSSLACSTLPANSLLNSIVLIEQGACSFDQQATNAQTAGAVGIVFYMANSSALTAPVNISTDFVGPTVMVSNSDGLNLKKYIDSNSGQTVTIDYNGMEQNLATFEAANGISGVALNQVASYSSFGPTPDGLIKPDLVAIGGVDGYAVYAANQFSVSGMYTPAQSYDPAPTFDLESLFSADRYMAADGTSFSAPLTAGAAALVMQAHPNLTPAQIKSALVNSAAQSITTDDFSDPVDVEWMGAGQLDANAAVSATVSVSPATASFGYATSGGAPPAAKTFTVTNFGSSAVTLAVSVTPNAPFSFVGGSATISAAPSSIALAAGASATLTVSVTGTAPVAGEYSGMVVLTGSGVTDRIPYMLLVGDGLVSFANVNPLSSEVGGYAGQDGGPLIVQIIDEYGVPIANSPVVFSIPRSGGVTFASYGNGEPACTSSSSSSVTCNTDQYGFAYTEVTLGSTPSQPIISIKAAGQTIEGQAFISALSSQPTTSPAGVVNGATSLGQLAPGSYITIYGSNLLDTSALSNYSVYNNLSYDELTWNAAALPTDGSLPLQFDFTTVTFDVPSAGISVPGYVSFVSPGQVNAWVPWELAGQSSAQMKVTTDEYTYGNVVTIPLQSTAPGFFLNGSVAIAQDQNYSLVSASNPAVPGQAIVLYCNGLGPVANQPASGAPAPGSPNFATTTTTPVVTIGGQAAQVLFSGLSPGFVGLYQVNVTVPPGLSAGNQPITIAIGGQTSPSQTAGSSAQTIVLPVK
jgi:minor extracellular serine protease Vpr